MSGRKYTFILRNGLSEGETEFLEAPHQFGYLVKEMPQLSHSLR
jgi:hypothetical protein